MLRHFELTSHGTPCEMQERRSEANSLRGLRIRAVAGYVVLVLVAGCDSGETRVGSESTSASTSARPESIQGSWRQTMVTVGGRSPDRFTNLSRVNLTFTSTQYSFHRDESGSFSYSAETGHLDLLPGDGARRGLVVECLCKLEGGRLYQCFPQDPESRRPRSFDTAGEPRVELDVFERVESP